MRACAHFVHRPAGRHHRQLNPGSPCEAPRFDPQEHPRRPRCSALWRPFLPFPGFDKINTTITNVNAILVTISVAVVTIAIIWAGFKMIFQGARLADVANVLIGGALIGGATAFASYIVSQGAAMVPQEAIYKGATRPAMKFGIPLVPLVVLFGSAMLLILWGGLLIRLVDRRRCRSDRRSGIGLDALRDEPRRPARPPAFRRDQAPALSARSSIATSTTAAPSSPASAASEGADRPA